MSPEDKARLEAEIFDVYDSEPDFELEGALERARLMARTFEAILSKRRQKQTDTSSDMDRARSFIMEEMEKARVALRKMGKKGSEILMPEDINRIRQSLDTHSVL
ncbi:hypothetical protein J2P12_06305 [Candidatus Bathyarchaeota archaeon]|nr:hypothetical protein [Candidatus Bathyarchaeota archaeon]